MDPSIHNIERRDRRGRRIPAIFALALIVVIGAIWVGLVGFLGTNAAFGTVETLEEQYICNVDDMDLSFPDLGTLSEVYTADGVELGKLTERNSQPVPLEEIPELVDRGAAVRRRQGILRSRGHQLPGYLPGRHRELGRGIRGTGRIHDHAAGRQAELPLDRADARAEDLRSGASPRSWKPGTPRTRFSSSTPTRCSSAPTHTG